MPKGPKAQMTGQNSQLMDVHRGGDRNARNRAGGRGRHQEVGQQHARISNRTAMERVFELCNSFAGAFCKLSFDRSLHDRCARFPVFDKEKYTPV